MESEVMFEAAVTVAAQKLGYDHLKDKQMTIIKEFVRGKYSFSLVVRNFLMGLCGLLNCCRKLDAR